MPQPKELLPEEFNDRLLPIFQSVLREGGLRFNPESFFKKWQDYMTWKIARTWEADGCVLGAMFTKDLFGDQLRAQVVFWFSLPRVRGLGGTREVFRTFEKAAKAAGCVDIQSAAHEAL